MPPITVYGSSTCEDSAIAVSRLRVLGVPFDEVDIDRDGAAEQRVIELNGGARITPTIVFEPTGDAVAEPTLEDLGARLAATGHDVRSARAIDYHGELVTRSLPVRRLPTADGGDFSLGRLRGRRQAALFLAHDAACLVCHGYARQLARREAEFAEVDGTPIIVVDADPAQVAPWRDGIAPGIAIVADAGGGWKSAIASLLDLDPADAILVMLDRFGAPRAGSAGADAGALIDPLEAIDWLRYLALECPECSGEIAWPSSP